MATQISELKLPILSKILFSTAAAAVVGRATSTKLRGTQNEVRAVTNALLAAKQLDEELRKPDATVQSIADKLCAKHAAAQEFEQALGVPFPL